LSGGATFGRFHIGLIKALYEQDLMPRIICGSSVGGLIGAFICSRSIKELPQVIDVATYVDKPLLKYRKDSILGVIGCLLRGEPVLDAEYLKNIVRKEIGDLTFKEVHDKFKWNLNITVTDS